MAYAKYIKKLDVVEVHGKRGKVLLDPYEADHILADLQVMYHMVTLGLGKEGSDEQSGTVDSKKNR